MLPTVVKYLLKLFALHCQCRVGPTPLDVINVSVTVVFMFCNIHTLKDAFIFLVVLESI